MQSVHINPNPEEAVCIHQTLRSSFSTGSHFGTFRGADQPRLDLQKAKERHGIADEEFTALQVGASLKIKRF